MELARMGGVLREARERAGLSQRAVAQSAAMSPSMLSQIESGKKMPGLASLMRLASVVGLEISALATTTSAPNKAG